MADIVTTDEEFLAQAEDEIRGYGRLVISGIVAIGKKLVEVKERVGHGNYEAFVRDRLGFSLSTARNFVHTHELFKSANFADLASLQIDVSAVFLLARPSTPNEVRTEALEKASTESISYAEVENLINRTRGAVKNYQDRSSAQTVHIVVEHSAVEPVRLLVPVYESAKPTPTLTVADIKLSVWRKFDLDLDMLLTRYEAEEELAEMLREMKVRIGARMSDVRTSPQILH